MAGQKDNVGNNFLGYKVDVALYNFLLKLINSSVLGTEVSVLPCLGSLALKKRDGGRMLLEARDCHTVPVCKLLPFQEAGPRGPPACPPIGQKICGQLYKDHGLDKWLQLYSNTFVSPS